MDRRENANAGYDARQDTAYDAALAAAVLDSVQSAGLDRMCFFFVADDPANPLGNWGMLDGTHRPKPVYEAFRFWHALVGAQLPLTVSPDQSQSDAVGRIGGVGAEGQTVTVLLYNFLPYDPAGRYSGHDQSVDVVVTGLRVSRFAWTRQVIDRVHLGGVVGHGGVSGPTARLHFTVPGESVSLLTLRPAV